MNAREQQLIKDAEDTRQQLLKYWCETAALNATEAGTCFGYGKHKEGRKLLLKALYASDMVKKITKGR